MPRPAPPPEAPDLLDDPRLTAVGLLFEAASGLGALLHRQVAGHGLATSEFGALLRLARSPGGALRMTDLATQADLSTSGLTRLVDRLEARGLVERRACATDGRGSLAVVTGAGATLVTDALPEHLELIEAWFTGPLGPERLDALLDGLRTVRDAVRPGAEAGAEGPTAAP